MTTERSPERVRKWDEKMEREALKEEGRMCAKTPSQEGIIRRTSVRNLSFS